MFSGSDSLSAAVESAKEQELKPLIEESAETLDLDAEQAELMDAYLHAAWFFGIRTGHTVIARTKMGQSDPEPVILEMQGEFQEMLERLGDALDTSVAETIAAWNYLGRAWVAGSRFWEVEITARLIERQAGDFDQALRRLAE